MEKHLILHAAGMDLQVFYDFADRYKLDRKFPTKVYDTQVPMRYVCISVF